MSDKKIDAKKIYILVIVLLFVATIVLAYNLIVEKWRHELALDASHNVFVTTFVDFCCLLGRDDGEFALSKQQHQIDICLVTIKASRFRRDQDLMALLVKLKLISSKGTDLKVLLDEEIIDEFYRLSGCLGNEQIYEDSRDLVKDLNKSLKKILDGIE